MNSAYIIPAGFGLMLMSVSATASALMHSPYPGVVLSLLGAGIILMVVDHTTRMRRAADRMFFRAYRR